MHQTEQGPSIRRLESPSRLPKGLDARAASPCATHTAGDRLSHCRSQPQDIPRRHARVMPRHLARRFSARSRQRDTATGSQSRRGMTYGNVTARTLGRRPRGGADARLDGAGLAGLACRRGSLRSGWYGAPARWNWRDMPAGAALHVAVTKGCDVLLITERGATAGVAPILSQEIWDTMRGVAHV